MTAQPARLPGARLMVAGALALTALAGCQSLPGAGTAPGGTPDDGVSSPAPDGGGSPSPGPDDGLTADLTVEVDATGEGTTTTWTLTCGPAGGDHPDPEAACGALAAAWPDAFDPVPAGTMCTQQYGGPQTARVTGTVAGEPVSARFSRTDGCEIGRWDEVADLLGGRGGV